MTRNYFGLWVSALVLTGLFASCGGNSIGTAQFDGTDEVALADAAEFAPEADLADDRSASYTPGLPCILAAGVTNPDIFKYGWKAGNVSENAAPKWVQLKTVNNVLAKVLYNYQETVPGRLKKLTITGQSSRLRVEILNYNTNAYDTFGVYNLSSGPAVINLPLHYAPNGSSWVRLTEAVNYTLKVTKIEAQVL